MNFTLPFATTSTDLVSWSPNGLYLAVPEHNKLCIKDGQTACSLLTSFTCADTIKLLVWAPDSSLIVTGTPSCHAANPGDAVLQVWKLTDAAWKCTLKCGTAGLLSVIWAPDSKHLVVTENLNIRVTVWSLVTRSVVTVLRHPKSSCNPSLQFNCDGTYLAAAERFNCRDYISLLETRTWQIVKKFSVSTRDMAGLSWGRGGDRGSATIIAVWDGVLSYGVTLYAMCGRALTNIRGTEAHALGIRTVSWTPHGHFLLIGGYDTKMCVVNNMTWNISCEGIHSTAIDPVKPIVVDNVSLTCESGIESYGVETRVFVEAVREQALTPGKAEDSNEPVTDTTNQQIKHIQQIPAFETFYSELFNRPVRLAEDSVVSHLHSFKKLNKNSSGGYCIAGQSLGMHFNPTAFDISGGVIDMLFSPDSRFVATRLQELPNVVYVWTMPKLDLLCVLVHRRPVADISWSPRHCRLAIATGTDTIFLWTYFGCLTIPVPSVLSLQCHSISWHPSGSRLLVANQCGKFAVCYLGATFRTQQINDEKLSNLGHLL